MREMLLAAALAVLLGGCTNSNRIGVSGGSSAGLDQGVLVIGFDRAVELDTTPFVAVIRAVGPTGVVEPGQPDAKSPRGAIVSLPRKRPLEDRPGPLFAFALAPGDYVLAKVGIGVDVGSGGVGGRSGGIWTSARSGFTDGLLGAGLAVLVKESQEASEGEPLVWVDGNVAMANAPRFRVGPGEVIYLGDILIGAEIRDTPADAAATPDEKNRTGGTGYRQTRLFAEYAVNEAAAREFAVRQTLGQRKFRTQAIRLSSGERAMFPNDSKPPSTATQLSVVRARQSPALVPLTPASQPAAAQPATQGGTRSLKERFLAGEISQEEYERARRAAGQ